MMTIARMSMFMSTIDGDDIIIAPGWRTRGADGYADDVATGRGGSDDVAARRVSGHGPIGDGARRRRRRRQMRKVQPRSQHRGGQDEEQRPPGEREGDDDDPPALSAASNAGWEAPSPPSRRNRRITIVLGPPPSTLHGEWSCLAELVLGELCV
jgi:hypothetical protein